MTTEVARAVVGGGVAWRGLGAGGGEIPAAGRGYDGEGGTGVAEKGAQV